MAEIRDLKAEAQGYLKEKKVLQLFEELGAAIVLAKPDNPEEFMITKLKEYIAAKESKKSLSFFNAEDIATMFTVFDPTGRGWITSAQYAQALRNFGVEKPRIEVANDQKVGRKTFEANMLTELLNRSITAPSS